MDSRLRGNDTVDVDGSCPISLFTGHMCSTFTAVIPAQAGIHLSSKQNHPARPGPFC
jgi:hypothetical protein